MYNKLFSKLRKRNIETLSLEFIAISGCPIEIDWWFKK